MPSSDLFDRFTPFRRRLATAENARVVSTQYRLALEGPLDRAIVVRDPESGKRRSMLCFDSNSYLGLHLHADVIRATEAVLRVAGYGTPSAQLLCGTNRWLRQLEETVAAFHDREAALIFPSGYAANVGVLTALVRPADAVVRDRFSHASIHDGARYAHASTKHSGVYAHRDVQDLKRALAAVPANTKTLVATDGVFSMHGTLAPIPEIAAAARAQGARLLIDDAHGTGVLGPRGRGIEDHFASANSRADILVGTFSKAAGTVGGYVTGSRDLIDYLRFHAHASVFTASPPSAICAGVIEAFRLMQADSEPRERLWSNARRFHMSAVQLGLTRTPLESPIIPILAGDEARLDALSRSLYDDGIKCGSVRSPAVPRGQCILRFSINARHTDQDIDCALAALERAFQLTAHERVA